jgi:hypothetical protein
MSSLDTNLLYTGDGDKTLQFGSEHGILYPFHSFRNETVFHGVCPPVFPFIIVFISNYPTSSFFCSLNQRLGYQSPKLYSKLPSVIPCACKPSIVTL